MKALVTSGGTFESIDQVRTIKNTSSGRLGQLIADALIDSGFEVDYVCGVEARRPLGQHQSIEITDVLSLEKTMKHLLEQYNYDLIVHAMAVSDYRIQSVTTIDTLASKVENQINVKEIMNSLSEDLDRSSKLGSEMDDLVVMMKKSPKIIGMIRALQPQACLIGFKLLVDVSVEHLIDVGYNLLLKNNCDFVLANDLKTIQGDEHVGYLIDTSKQYTTYHTKQEIANVLALKAVEELKQ